MRGLQTNKQALGLNGSNAANSLVRSVFKEAEGASWAPLDLGWISSELLVLV